VREREGGKGDRRQDNEKMGDLTPEVPPPLPSSLSDYLGEANANIATLAMIETKEAIDNLDEICAVDGLDGVFIGNALPPSLPPSLLPSLPPFFTPPPFPHALFQLLSHPSLPPSLPSLPLTGPNDLALSIGLPPSSDPTNTEVLRVIENIRK